MQALGLDLLTTRNQAPCQTAAGAAPTNSSPSLVTESVATKSSSPVSSESSSLAMKCDQCQYSNATQKGLNQHIRMKHQIPQIDGLVDPVSEASKHPRVQEKISQTEKS